MNNSIQINGNELKKFVPSTTGANFLFDLGYVYHSTNREGIAHKINASAEDHQKLINYVESAEYWVADSTQAIGSLLAAVNFDEINEGSLRDIGYLISGLGDLQSLIKSVRDVIKESAEEQND